MSNLHGGVEPSPGALQLARGITATWWYTVSGVLMFEALSIGVWCMAVLAAAVDGGTTTSTVLLIGIGGLVWMSSTLLLLSAYRHRGGAEPPASWARIAVPLGIAAVYGAAAGASVGSWLLALTPLAQSLVLLGWPAGVRIRVVGFLTAALLGLAIVDGIRQGSPAVGEWLAVVYSVVMPAATVSSLWWWDVLVVLDRARASEARLAATQERLRLATDVHDLQGHHLQVIALQLELAERLHAGDPDASLAQLRAARASVDEARQGTRDLATRFRSAPLSVELANARDLLIAAGLSVEARIAADADLAPAGDLGPVIRETTTNVLRHGGGNRASLSLHRSPEGWRYEIANDASNAGEQRDGSGLDGIRRRIAEAGGVLEVRREEEFTVIATVPDASPPPELPHAPVERTDAG